VSLLARKPSVLGRSQRAQRDDRMFVVATEDRYAPAQYFKAIQESRVVITVLPSEDDRSAPQNVVDRLKAAHQAGVEAGDILPGDQFWVLLDTDHWVRGQHVAGLLEALRQARQLGFQIAMTNPCFELWLLLHHQEVAPRTVFGACAEAEARLRAVLGGYNKCKLKTAQFPKESIANAVRRARALESNPDSPAGPWPETAGSRIYQLIEAVQNRNA